LYLGTAPFTFVYVLLLSFVMMLKVFIAAATAEVLQEDSLDLLQTSMRCDMVQNLAAEQTAFWKHQSHELSLAAVSLNATQKGTERDVDQFLRDQQDSSRTCHAKLYRYRNMLNHLHEDVNLVYSKERALVESIQAEEAVIGDLVNRIKHVVADAKKKKKECKEQKEEACKQRDTYSLELKELKQVGQSPTQPLALFQTVLRRVKRSSSTTHLEGHQHVKASMSARHLANFHRDFQACVATHGGEDFSLLQLEQEPEDFEPTGETVSEHKHADTVTFSEKKCTHEKKKLESAWRKAFMTIEDLFDSSNQQCDDDSCEKAADTELETLLPPMHQEQADRIKNIRLAQHELVSVRADMEVLEKSMKKTEEATKDVQKECGELKKGSKYLEEVRSLIQNLKRCPGTAGAAFRVPHYQGVAVVTDLDVIGSTWKEFDERLTAACKDAAPEGDKEDTRAATQTELRGKLVNDLPKKNLEKAALYGTCPGCRGVEYQGAVDGRLRRCFKSGAQMCCKGESKDCKENLGYAVCVLDKPLGM